MVGYTLVVVGVWLIVGVLELEGHLSALSVIFLRYKDIIICVIDTLLAYQPISPGIYV